MKRYLLVLALALLATGATQLPAQVVVEASVRRGYLGFAFEREPQRQDGAVTLNLTVTDVVKDSPAQQAGLRKGDVILRLNGLSASEPLLASISRSLEPGDTVTLRIRRDGREREVRVIAAEPPQGYFVARGMYGVTSDSVRGLLRLYVDSMRAGLDTTHFKFFRDTTGARTFIFTDSAGEGDSVVVRRFMQRLPRGAVEFDSVFARMPMDSMVRHFRFDSTLHRFPFDSMRGEIRIFPGEADRVFEFAVPAPGMPGMDKLTVFGVGTRALAGARLETLNSELARYFRTERGVLVLEVPENTPARRAGLRGGDVIVAADGKRVSDVRDVFRAFAPGRRDAVRLEVVRNGERRTLELTK